MSAKARQFLAPPIFEDDDKNRTASLLNIVSLEQNINQATAQGLASTRQAEKAAQDLDALARKLSEIVGEYQA